MIRASRLTARPLTARRLTAYKLGQTGPFDPLILFRNAEEGTFLDFTTSQVYADTLGTDPAEVGEGIAFVDDKSPNDTDATQATSTARPIFARVPVGGRRNLLERTEEFDNAAWVKTQVTVSANTVVAPDGTLTADKVALNTAFGFHEILNSFTSVSGTAYTGSYFVKAAEHRFVQLLGPGAVFAEYANFDLVSGTRTAGTSGFGAIQSVGNGWYRISLSAIALSASVTARISLALIESGTAGRAAVFTGDGTSGIYIWGAQLEVAATPSAYQKVVTQHDITEAGVPSVYKAFFDRTDDILPITLPAITGGTVALVGLNGIWIEDNWDYAGGTLNIGPTTIAGLPAGILDVVGGACTVIILNRAFTAAERAGVVAWGKARGAVAGDITT